MASWLTHLRIAEKIINRIKGIDKEYFLIGSIAPDSCSQSEAAEKYDCFSDFINYDTLELSIKEFYNNYMLPEKILSRSDKTRSFLWGYYFHLLTDKYWHEKFNTPFKEMKNSQEEAAEEKSASSIEEELLALDFNYLKNNGTLLIEELKNHDVNITFLNEIDISNVNKYNKKVIELYTGKPIELKELKYINKDELDEFISNAAEKCIRILL